MKILSAASSHPERNPKPPSRTEMDALSCREDSGGGLPQDGNGKHGILAGLGLAGPRWHGLAAGHSIPCSSWMI